jgi:multisubunit Na+/H+ antiporter MnhB subunit
MLIRDCLILIGVGGLFLVIGIMIYTWGKREEERYYSEVAKRPGDTREFVERWPPRQQPGALKLGGAIAIALGAVLLVTGGIFCLLAL